MNPKRKDEGGRKSVQHPYHPQPKPSSVQSAVGSALQDSDSTATNEHARTDHHLSQILVCEEFIITIVSLHYNLHRFFCYFTKQIKFRHQLILRYRHNPFLTS